MNAARVHYLSRSLIFFILLLLIEFCAGRESDTLSTGQTLTDGDFLVSVNKTFTLGFFSPVKSLNRYRYLGISYTNLEENRVVWVANRDNPVSSTSGVVSFHTSNKLVLYESVLKRPIWSTSFLGRGKNYSAQLLDTGNLVVFEENKEGVIAWQSFDHPTHTWLPEMKIGMNRKTGLNWSLTSWKSNDDPGIGQSSFRLDITWEFSELCLYRGTKRAWRSGPLNGARLGDISPKYFFNVTYVDNEDGVYMTYGRGALPTVAVMEVIPNGFMTMSEWNPYTLNLTDVWMQPNWLCDEYNLCGENKYCGAQSETVPSVCSCFPGFEPKNIKKVGGGCLRKRGRNVCRNGEGFVKLSSMKMPDTINARVDMERGWQECKEECLRDCNCTAYANATDMGIACVMWYGNLLDTRKYEINESDGHDLYVRVDAVELAHYMTQQHYSSSNKKLKVVAVATSVGVVAAFTAIFMLYWHRRKRKGGSRSVEDYGPKLFQETEIGGQIPLVDLISVVDATNNFSDENKLGQGGFGSVYKGTLKNGQVIAVKRLSEKSGQALDEFMNEATLICRLQHRNLVRLLGCCVEQEEKILIYEFMPNKSLNSLIFDKKEGSCLDWTQRFNIIMGIARGLVYLHHDSRLKIIHRDLKPNNILLDAQMNPKISDFGMARFFANDEVEAITKRIVGTYGYMSPEYAMEGICSIKSDVYSFGILLLEIISGRKNNSFYKEESLNLVGHVWKLWCEERAIELIDSTLLGDYSTKTVLRCIHVGLLSLQLNADDRPTMFEINEMLLGDLNLPPPGKPAYISAKFDNIHASLGAFTSSSSSGGGHSVNYPTLSVFVPG